VGKLEKKIALVTGGNSGIGLATAKQFVSEGAYVFITGRREAELAAAVKAIGKNIAGGQGDMSKLGDLDRLFAQIGRDKGRLDILFANAGAAKYAPLGSITEELYDSIFGINVKHCKGRVGPSARSSVSRSTRRSLRSQSRLPASSDLETTSSTSRAAQSPTVIQSALPALC
jgi:NAD(P)-dependent dehydrogenase (short-subunit alcohol dehydrogenase family)